MTFYTDGGCSMSNQLDASKRTMISVVADEEGNILSDVSNHGGSNNIAELMAMEHALDIALKMKAKKLHIISDSVCAISQFNKDESKRSPKSIRKMNDYEWYSAIKGRIEELKQYIDVTLEWQGRDYNLAGFYIENEYNL